jgi:porin
LAGRADEPVIPTAPPVYQTLTGWLQPRRALSDKGISFDISLTLDGSKNLRGGIDTAGSAWRNLFEATLTVDTKPLFGLDGGKLFIDFQNQSGQNGSNQLVGDVQHFSNVDADGRTQIAQLWYQQTFADGNLRFKIGKVDANSEFEKSDYSGEFLHSSAQFSPTILPLPTYPDPATSFNVFLQSSSGFYGGFGVYDGSLSRGLHTGALGPKTFFRDPRDLFLIAEIGRRWGGDEKGLPGRLALGGWYDANQFSRLNGGFDSAAAGPYFLLDQMLWRPSDIAKDDKDDARGIALFVSGGEADRAISAVQWHLGAGVAWTGPLPKRNRDVLGTGVQAVRFNSAAGLNSNSEVAIETFYRLQITPWACIKPDLQYITTPGGSHPDAFVATVRFIINF